MGGANPLHPPLDPLLLNNVLFFNYDFKTKCIEICTGFVLQFNSFKKSTDIYNEYYI